MPRRFIRHPASIPIQIGKRTSRSHNSHYQTQTVDVSAGGLSCISDALIMPGELVEVEIALQQPAFKTLGHVVWCKKDGDRYLIGIGFGDLATAYAVRMVEQVCYIEDYRQAVLEEEGRELTSEEAALEWITRHAENFPQNVH